jgi:hypothetical protein
VKQNSLAVKVEVNHVFRGTILPVTTMRLNQKARDLFTTEVSTPVLASVELYGSKIVAALDRQHPRDFFDIAQMFVETGLTSAVKDCFICYLAGHNRPVHEVLFSRDRDMRMVRDWKSEQPANEFTHHQIQIFEFKIVIPPKV